MKSNKYEAIGCIEFQGKLSNTGESQGHYICDVRTQPHGKWYRTNDNLEPEEIKKCEVSQYHSRPILFSIKGNKLT